MEYDNARVLITDQKLETIKEVLPLLEQLTRINAPLLIIAEDVTGGRKGRLPPLLQALNHACIYSTGPMIIPYTPTSRQLALKDS